MPRRRQGWRRLAPICLAAVLAVAQVDCGPAHAQSLRSSRVGTGSAQPERVAIVVGNQDYESVSDLVNARKDAQDMAELLRSFRFNVFDGYDLDKRAFEELIRTAMVNIPEGADVVFYYAGHGIQIGRRNYLLPVDATFASIYDVPVETMTLDRVISTLAARGSAHVAILDSCRDNPFPDTRLAADLDATLFETRAGFDVFSTPINSLIAFSTSPGAVARDGEEGANSPYTAAILQTSHEMPDENVQSLFPTVRERVLTATQGTQVPWESSTLVRPFYFAPQDDDALPVLLAAANTGAGTTSDTGEARSGDQRSVDIARRFDRSVPLSADITAALGQDFSDPVVTEVPSSGNVTTDETGLVYVPEISDIRATELAELSLADRFRVDVTTADGLRRAVEVDLDLTVDACDLQAGDALDLDGVGVYRQPNEMDLAEGLDACEAAVQRAPDVARFHYQLGRLLQSLGRYDAAYEQFATAEAAGHIRAKYGLATLLATPRMDRALHDIPFDPDRARALLEEGISARDPYAMHRLGQQLLRKGETDADRRRGFELLEASVELGHTYSMNELGYYFLTPDSGHYIPERGMRYLQASRDHEDIYGYSNLAYVALNGLDGNPPDYAAALENFRIAAEGGHPTAPSDIGRMILRDQVPGQGPAEALDWYDMALARGDAWGGANGAVIVREGRVPGKGPADAALRAAKAALLANDEAAGIARNLLTELPGQALDQATQMALNELGAGITVDGQIGPGTRAAIARASEAAGLPDPGYTDPLDRLLQVSRLYWAEHPVRFDLF